MSVGSPRASEGRWRRWGAGCPSSSGLHHGGGLRLRCGAPLQPGPAARLAGVAARLRGGGHRPRHGGGVPRLSRGRHRLPAGDADPHHDLRIPVRHRAGALLAVCAATTGGSLVFSIAAAPAGTGPRYGGARLQRFAEALRRNAFGVIATFRVVPLFPFAVTNLVPAACGVRLRTFVRRDLPRPSAGGPRLRHRRRGDRGCGRRARGAKATCLAGSGLACDDALSPSALLTPQGGHRPRPVGDLRGRQPRPRPSSAAGVSMVGTRFRRAGIQGLPVLPLSRRWAGGCAIDTRLRLRPAWPRGAQAEARGGHPAGWTTSAWTGGSSRVSVETDSLVGLVRGAPGATRDNAELRPRRLGLSAASSSSPSPSSWWRRF